jgi:hypothetical protein
LASDANLPENQRERGRHSDFGAHLASTFTGRTAVVSEICRFFSDSESGCLLVYGAGGSGKSTLLAAAAAKARLELKSPRVIERYIGVTPSSFSLASLVRQICEEVGSNASATSDIHKMLEQALAVARKPLAIFIDAIDQLERGRSGHPLEIVPEVIPMGVHIVLSVRDGPLAKAVRRRLPKLKVIAVPPLTDREATAILETLPIR